ncbi:heterokaryon incompatibility, partial [Tothia fuscella]
MASGEDRLTEYDALSYTWGTEDKTETILCNGVELPITANLFQALRMLRPSAKERRYLWVDAICINQADESEKSDQVWNMLHIYQTARKVMAWLG